MGHSASLLSWPICQSQHACCNMTSRLPGRLVKILADCAAPVTIQRSSAAAGCGPLLQSHKRLDKAAGLHQH